MKSASTQQDNVMLYLFVFASIAALYFVQSRRVDINTQHTPTVIVAPTTESNRQKEAVKQESTTEHLKGELVTTDHKPEAGQAVTFSLKTYTNLPDAHYYLLLGKEKLAFQSGTLKHTFTESGQVNAELRCSFRGKDVLLDKDGYEVTKKMHRTVLAAVIEN